MSLQTLAEQEIICTFLALAALLAGAYIFGNLFEKIKAPRVVGEIVGGMVWGASCLYLFAPDFVSKIFMSYDQEGKVLNIFYQLGLVFLMFSSGFSTSINITKKNIKPYSMLFLGATVIPMLLGIGFIDLTSDEAKKSSTVHKVKVKAWTQDDDQTHTYFHSLSIDVQVEDFMGTANNSISFGIVFLIATAITSIPVISKIFFDINMMNTKFSNMVLTVSTIQDLCLWILLNLAISMAENENITILSLLINVIATIGFLTIAKLLEYIIKKKSIHVRNNILTISFLVILTCVFSMSLLNINIMYSAFISGYIMKALVGEDNKEVLCIKEVAFALFIPIYFALVGIKLDVIHNFSITRFILFFIVVFGLEFIGTVGVMLFSKFKKKTIISLGITMNARGGPGIVLATTAYSFNIIDLEFYTVLILTTMLSSAIAGYWLRIYKNDVKDEG